MGVKPVAFSPRVKFGRGAKIAYAVPVEFFHRETFLERFGTRALMYMIDKSFIDLLGLKRVFRKHCCDLVHAHSPEAAFYSYTQGLPTVYDDWEFFLHYYDYYGIDPETRSIDRFLNR